MKILLINGSPKGKRSNSLRLAKSFAEGIKTEKEAAGELVELEEVELASLKIASCRGCFACWKATPGNCVIKDDVPAILQKELQSDLVIWSFPLYYFNVPGLLKNLIDRQLPMSLPFMAEKTDGYGSGSHEARYDTSKTKHVLISTCGFYSAAGNYDSVCSMFNHFVGKDCYEAIFCGQGELFGIKELSEKTGQYLEAVKKAGYEYVKEGITEETRKELNTMLYPKEEFERMADASWGIDRETGEKLSEDLIFTRQMASLYNKASWDNKDRVLEMFYTDTNNTYQILLGKDGSQVFTDGSLSSTTRIETSFELWQKISRHEISGEEALGKGMYRVSGDFSLMMNWSKIFGGNRTQSESGQTDSITSDSSNASQAKNAASLKNPSMTAMLIPWIAFWIAVSINSGIGSLIVLGICALLPLIMGKRRLIIWDKLSLAFVAILSLAANISGNGKIITNIGYIIFGLFWLISCFTKEPLSAAYVKYSYGGENALKNPLFMRPNYILSACWGILYLLTSIWTFFLGRSGYGFIIPIVNNLVPVVMMIFTGWFSKWYPAWKARGGHSKKSV